MAIQIIDENYAEAYALEAYLIEEASDKSRILGYINECICLEHGELDKINYINESFIDGVKQFFSRIWEFLKKAFGKFKERVAELLTTDKKFLEKYKDIILKKPWKSHNVTDGYSYMEGIDNVTKIAAVNISYESAKSEDGLDLEGGQDATEELTEEKFVQKHLAATDPSCKATEIGEFIENSVKGEQQDRTTQYYELDKMYNYCVNFEKLNNQLNKNQDIINKNQQLIVSKLERRAAILDSKKAKNEAVFSNVYGCYITEANGQKVDNKPSNSTSENNSKKSMEVATVTDNSGKTDSEGNKVTNTTTANQMDKENEALKNNDNMSKDDIDKQAKQTDTNIENCKKFFQFCVSTQTNLYTVALAMYKDFMKLMRIHVRDYVGSEANETKDNANTGGEGAQTTDTNNNSNITVNLDTKGASNLNSKDEITGVDRVTNEIIAHIRNQENTIGKYKSNQVYDVNYKGTHYKLYDGKLYEAS